MNPVWLLMLACEGPVDLPPKVHRAAPSNARMVQMPNFRGFLQRPIQSNDAEAILKIVDQLNGSERASAKAFPHNIVLVIDRDQNPKSAHDYLSGLDGITTVRTICTGPCPSITALP